MIVMILVTIFALFVLYLHFRFSKKFKDVLSFLKPKVKARLEELGHPELATEEEPKGNA